MSILKFLHKQISVARVYGIPVRIDYRWFLVFAVVLWLIVANLRHGSATLPAANLPAALLLGMVTTLALFLSVFGHELSHALMARIEGIETEEIVLHPFGGLARLRSLPESPGAEFRIAIAGPAASFLFALLAFAGTLIAGKIGYQTAASVFFLVFFGNLLLAVFNLFPGYPLDGGRVLRAFLWHRGGNIADATRIAGRFGQVIAFALIAFGVFIVIARRDFFTGLWTVLIGLFLLDAANGVVKNIEGVEQATVKDAMSVPVTIEPDVLVSHFVDAILPMHRQTSFLVARNNRLHGVLTLEDLKALPRERWRQVRASEVMRPVSPLLFVAPSTSIARANEIMRSNGIGALAVIDQSGALVGFLQRGTLKQRK
ncbi:MAG: site-2 protease family protein [Pyrinomonadaceae bacterium]|nr:site-2 protease family protein [Pyrinomonadaceae bacterium]